MGLRLVAPLANLDTRLEVTDSRYYFDGSQTERFGGQIKSPFRPFLYVVTYIVSVYRSYTDFYVLASTPLIILR